MQHEGYIALMERAEEVDWVLRWGGPKMARLIFNLRREQLARINPRFFGCRDMKSDPASRECSIAPGAGALPSRAAARSYSTSTTFRCSMLGQASAQNLGVRGGPVTPVGQVDFAKSCEDCRAPALPAFGRGGPV